MTSLDPDHMKKVVVPRLVQKCVSENLCVRHGAVLGLAEVILALGGTEKVATGMFNELDEATLASVVELVGRIEKARLYRGRGGEIMRSAVCRLIECMSQTRLPLTVKQQVHGTGNHNVCLTADVCLTCQTGIPRFAFLIRWMRA